jgi:hypothetical protein
MKSFPRGFLILSVLSLFMGACSDPQRCELGALECLCTDEGQCEGEAVCVAGTCEACPFGTPECPCFNQTCGAGLVCVTAEDRCVPENDAFCGSSCAFNADTECDDGGPLADTAICNFGTDCSQCGPRRNPCRDPESPVFCPDTPGENRCWPAFTDCNSIAVCEDVVLGCDVGSRVDCSTTPATCVPSPCVGDSPVYCHLAACEAFPADCCFPENADCRTATSCGDEPEVCVGRTNSDTVTVILICSLDGSAAATCSLGPP